MALGKKSKIAVGLDIGANSIKLVKLRKKGNSYTLKALAIKELPRSNRPEDERCRSFDFGTWCDHRQDCDG